MVNPLLNILNVNFIHTLKIKFKNPSDFLEYYLIFMQRATDIYCPISVDCHEFKARFKNKSMFFKIARKIKLKRFMIILF